MVTEIIQDVAIILLACTCIVQTIRYRRLGTAVNNWVPQMRTYTIDLGNDSRIVMNVGPTAPSERAIYGVHDGFVSIPLSAFLLNRTGGFSCPNDDSETGSSCTKVRSILAGAAVQ